MAKVYVTEYTGLAVGKEPIGLEPSGVADYTVSVSTVSAVTTQAFDAAATFIRVHTDTICSIAIVATTTGAATTTNKRLPADATEYFGVKTGYHVAVIANS